MLNVVSRPTNDGLVDVYSTQCRFRLVDSLLITPQIARNLSPPRENGKTKMDQSNASTVSPFSQSNQSFFRSNAARACLLTHGVVGWCVGIILEGIHSQFAQFGWIQGGFDIFVEFQAGGIDFLHELSEVIELRTKSRQNPKKFFLHDFYFLRPHSDSINRGLQRELFPCSSQGKGAMLCCKRQKISGSECTFGKVDAKLALRTRTFRRHRLTDILLLPPSVRASADLSASTKCNRWTWQLNSLARATLRQANQRQAQLN